MAKKAFYISTVALSLVLFVGCSGGNSGVISGAGKRCDVDGASYNPLPFDLTGVDGASKVSLKSEDNEIPSGTYIYTSVQVYYYDSKSGVQLHAQEDAANQKDSFVCVRNVPSDGSSINATKSVTTSMTVQDDGTVTFKVRNFALTLDNRKLSFTAQDATNSNFKTIESVFSSRSAQIQLYKRSETGYEIRTTESVGTVRKDLVVSYSFAKAPEKKK